MGLQNPGTSYSNAFSMETRNPKKVGISFDATAPLKIAIAPILFLISHPLALQHPKPGGDPVT